MNHKLVVFSLIGSFSLLGGIFQSVYSNADAIRRRPGERYVYTTIKSALVKVKVLRYVQDSLKVWRLPRIVDTTKIEYDAIAKQAGVQGKVGLVSTINKNGEVIQSRQVSSSGNSALDESARGGVTKIRFAPPKRRKGSGIMAFPYEIMVEVVFSLTFDHKIMR